MLNHARTLLLNRSGNASSFTARPGEEIIPAGFRELTSLPGYITAPRRVLFGPQSDWLFENYRVRQYMSLLHSTELVEFVEALDPRITYDVNNRDLFDGVFGTIADKPDLRFSGTTIPADAVGQSLRKWRITVLDESTVRIAQKLPVENTSDHEYTTSQGWSNLIELGCDTFFISFKPVVGRSWLVDQKLKPQRSLGEIMANLEQATPAYWNDLFGVGTPRGTSEPWLTFRNLWYKHPELPYRLGGFLMAIIYSMDARRTAGG